MSQVVSVHQPNFMPWLKLLDKILASDVYVAYDTVKFTKSEYHSRQKMKKALGPAWLTVPVVKNGDQNIDAVRVNNSHRDNGVGFRRQHLRLLAQEYRRAKYFDDVYQIVDDVYARNQEFLVELNVDLITAFCTYLGSATRIVRASSLTHDGDNTQRLVQLVRNAGGDTHLTSTFDSSRQYIDWRRMQAAHISIHSQDFDHPTYQQLWGGDFVPHLSALDMLFCCGPETKNILDARRRIIAVPEHEE